MRGALRPTARVAWRAVGAPCLAARLCATEARRVTPEAPGRPAVAAGPGQGAAGAGGGASEAAPCVLNDASPGSVLPVGGAGSVVRRPFLKPPSASEVSADVFRVSEPEAPPPSLEGRPRRLSPETTVERVVPRCPPAPALLAVDSPRIMCHRCERANNKLGNQTGIVFSWVS